MHYQNLARALLATLALAAGAFSPGLSQAQETSTSHAQPAASGAPTTPATVATPTSSTQLTEVVITAHKRTETLQKTAIAASVATGSDLVQRGVMTTADLSKVAPSVQLTFVRQQTQIYVRGIGSSITASNADPAVAVNANGVYLPTELSSGAFFDVERVEILPGPQGTLYGRNASGGVINLLTRKPGDQFAGEAYIEGGNYGTINVFAATDLPVAPNLSLRAAVLSQNHDGYVKGLDGSRADGRDSIDARLSALYTPTTKTKIFSSLSFGRNGGDQPPVDTNNPPVNGNPYSIPVDFSKLNSKNDYETWIGTFQVDQQLTDHITLSEIAGYSHIGGSSNIELFSVGPATVYVPLLTNSYTTETRIAGDYERWKWIGGFYYYKLDSNFATIASLPVPVVSTGPFNQKADGYAFFGQATYSLTDRLRLTGGLRYSDDEKALVGTNATAVPGKPAAVVAYSGSRDNNRVDYKAEVEFDLAPRSLLYASFATGYNEGGFSSAPAASGSTAAAPFNPATLNAYTVGTKNELFDRRLQLNLEAFYYDYKNYQVSTRNLLTGQNQIFNAAAARSYGLQIDSKLAITRNDEVDASVGLLDAVATQLLIPPATNLNGYKLPFSPATTIEASYRHTWALPTGAKLQALGSVRRVSALWASFNHLPGTYEPSYAKLDANLTYTPQSGRWSVALYGRNLTDKATFSILNGGALPGPAAGFVDAPRTYGVRVSANF